METRKQNVFYPKSSPSLDDSITHDCSMSFNQILKAKEVHIFGTCRTANLQNESIKLIRNLTVPHTNLYYIERSQTVEDKNISIYTQPANYTTKLTDIYDSIKYLTTTESEKYFTSTNLDDYKSYAEVFHDFTYDPDAIEERRKDFKKGKETLCDHLFREDPTTPDFYALIYNLTHHSWYATRELKEPFNEWSIPGFVHILDTYGELLNYIEMRDLPVDELRTKIEAALDATFIMIWDHLRNEYLDKLDRIPGNLEKKLKEKGLSKDQTGELSDEYVSEDITRKRINVPFASYFFTFKQIATAMKIGSHNTILPCNTHPLQREFELLVKITDKDLNPHATVQFKRENIPKFPKIKFDLCVFEIWNIDEHRFNKGLFAGLNIPFKPQSPHRLYPNYLIDKTTLSEDEAWKLLQEMSDMVGNCPILIIGPYLSPTLGDKVNIKRRKNQEILKTLVEKLPSTEYFDLTHEIEKDTSILISEPGSDGHETHLTEKGEIIITNIILSFVNKHLPDHK